MDRSFQSTRRKIQNIDDNIGQPTTSSSPYGTNVPKKNSGRSLNLGTPSNQTRDALNNSSLSNSSQGTRTRLMNDDFNMSVVSSDASLISGKKKGNNYYGRFKKQMGKINPFGRTIPGATNIGIKNSYGQFNNSTTSSLPGINTAVPANPTSNSNRAAINSTWGRYGGVDRLPPPASAKDITKKSKIPPTAPPNSPVGSLRNKMLPPPTASRFLSAPPNTPVNERGVDVGHNFNERGVDLPGKINSATKGVSPFGTPTKPFSGAIPENLMNFSSSNRSSGTSYNSPWGNISGMSSFKNKFSPSLPSTARSSTSISGSLASSSFNTPKYKNRTDANFNTWGRDKRWMSPSNYFDSTSGNTPMQSTFRSNSGRNSSRTNLTNPMRDLTLADRNQSIKQEQGRTFASTPNNSRPSSQTEVKRPFSRASTNSSASTTSDSYTVNSSSRGSYSLNNSRRLTNSDSAGAFNSRSSSIRSLSNSASTHFTGRNNTPSSVGRSTRSSSSFRPYNASPGFSIAARREAVDVAQLYTRGQHRVFKSPSPISLTIPDTSAISSMSIPPSPNTSSTMSGFSNFNDPPVPLSQSTPRQIANARNSSRSVGTLARPSSALSRPTSALTRAPYFGSKAAQSSMRKAPLPGRVIPGTGSMKRSPGGIKPEPSSFLSTPFRRRGSTTSSISSTSSRLGRTLSSIPQKKHSFASRAKSITTGGLKRLGGLSGSLSIGLMIGQALKGSTTTNNYYGVPPNVISSYTPPNPNT